jgi:hypothetical protein
MPSNQQSRLWAVTCEPRRRSRQALDDGAFPLKVDPCFAGRNLRWAQVGATVSSRLSIAIPSYCGENWTAAWLKRHQDIDALPKLLCESDVDAMPLLNSELFDAVPQSPKRHPQYLGGRSFIVSSLLKRPQDGVPLNIL